MPATPSVRTVLLTLLTLLVAPGLAAQVVRQVTDAPTGRTSLGALDDAGSFVHAISSTDPLGTNPGHVFQLFRWNSL